MRKTIQINGRKTTLKTREPYAPVERVVSSKKQYKRSKEKKQTQSDIKTYTKEAQ